METVEARWVSLIEKRIADLERDRDEDRKKLDEAHREIERLTQRERALRLNTGGYHTLFSDGHRMALIVSPEYSFDMHLFRPWLLLEFAYFDRKEFFEVEEAHWNATALDSGEEFFFKDENGAVHDISLGSRGEAMTVHQFAVCLTAAVTGKLIEKEALYMGMLDHPSRRELVFHYTPFHG